MQIVQASLCCSLFAAASAVSGGAQPLSPLPTDGFNFVGRWDCAGSFRGGKVHQAAFTGALILNGKWLELSEQDVEPATGYVAKYLIGYDPQDKRIIEFDASNFGAAVYTSEQGWQNHALTMTSTISQDAQTPYAADRFIYSVSGSDTFTVEWQISKSANLKWTQADYLACKRSKP